MAKIKNEADIDNSNSNDSTNNNFTSGLPLGDVDPNASPADYVQDGSAASTTALDLNFDLKDDYKPVPVIPQGTYYCGITDTSINLKSGSIQIELTLEGNSGVLSDGETPIDGSKIMYHLWLPKENDDKEYTSSGRQTKKQWKVNNMHEFFMNLEHPVTNWSSIMETVNNKTLVGRQLMVEISIEEYKGRMQSRAQNVAPVKR